MESQRSINIYIDTQYIRILPFFKKISISIFTSQNYRMVEVEETSGSLCSKLCSSRATWSKVLGPCPLALEDLQRGDSTVCLSGQPGPALSHISWCSEETPCMWDCAYCLLSWHWAPSENGLSTLCLPIRYLHTLMRLTMSLLFSRVNRLTQSFLIEEVLQSLSHLSGPLLDSL